MGGIFLSVVRYLAEEWAESFVKTKNLPTLPSLPSGRKTAGRDGFVEVEFISYY
jgi:hypothetical protein